MDLSEAERLYILQGVKTDFRADGRKRAEYRHIELETNLVEHAFGSARVRLFNTDVLVSTKVDVDTPSLEYPNEGNLEFFVDCSANATPDFEGRGGDELAIEIANTLSSAFKSARALDLKKLCIYKGKKCWKINVDILILECGGNLCDAVSLAVKAAIHDTKIPKINEINLDGDNIELEISEHESESWKFDVKNIPIIVTLHRIAEYCIVDPSDEEEDCVLCSALVAISNSKFTCILKVGTGSFRATTLIKGLAVANAAGDELNRVIMEALKEGDNLDKSDCTGFQG